MVNKPRTMAQVELLMPKMGESIFEATILTWLKKPGDKIEQDEAVLEVATDKVDTEVPTTHVGVLKEILAKEGEVIKVGSAIAIITTDGDDNNETDHPAQAINLQDDTSENKILSTGSSIGTSSNNHNGILNGDFKSPSRFYSPLVKNIAKEENISINELETITGSGAENRVTKKDIMEYVQNRKLGNVIQATPKHTDKPASTSTFASVNSGDEVIQMDRMRKMIAERMVDSKRIAPHVTSFVEADVSNVVFWRNKVKNEFQKRDGDILTFTPIFIEAVVLAIKDYPLINIQVDGDKIIKKRDINIGMAVALPSGNLIVPVIKNADKLSISDLTKAVNDLATRARDGKLKPDELSGGTFTISNVGSFGNVMGTPIIVQPQVGIIALGAVQKKPSVVDTPYGDAIVVRHKMFLSHSYDHRVVDGALGGMMVRRVADYLEKFDVNRVI